MKKIIVPAAAIVMALSFSAFTSAKRVTSNFFEYKSSSLLQSDIQNPANYRAASSSAACSGSQNVCGVTLPTAKNINATPDATEFSNESTNLWDSQTAHSPQSAAVDMKP